MPSFTIHARLTRAPLFTGDYASLRHCVEAAIAQNISLSGADLGHADLSSASLDGANLRNADLSYANLHGINLSESDLTGACLHACDLTSACLCESRLQNVSFTDASFGGTLITDAVIEGCLFSCPTALTLPFADARLGRNVYMHDNLEPVDFSAAPIVVSGLPKRVAFFDRQALIGDRLIALTEPPADILHDFIKKYAS